MKKIHIELLKFIAMVLIINTHMAPLYPKYDILATGGTIGNALFFFCSGLTLFLGRNDRFDNWYKRRIGRIYPSVIAWAIIAYFVFGHVYNVYDIIVGDNYWFISCIMIYYVFLYVIRNYLLSFKKAVFYVSCGIPIIWYLCVEDGSTYFMYGKTMFKYFYWFPFMLLGAYVGGGIISVQRRLKWDIVGLLVCTILHYGILFACTKYRVACPWQPVSLIPLFGVVFFLYKISSCNAIKELMNSRIGHGIAIMGGLCLEVYIIQLFMFTTSINNLFPINLLIVFTYTIAVAYVVRILGRILKQTFEREDYRWREIVKL